MPPIEQQVKKSYVFKGKILNVRCDDVLTPSGKTAKREIVEHSGGSAVLYVNELSEVLLIRQYRYAIGRDIYEIPAGKAEKREEPALTAMREFEEETGFTADMSEYGVIYPTPGYCEEKIYIFLAKNVKRGKASPDEDEYIDIEFMPIKEAYKKVISGEIADAKTAYAILRYALENKIHSK